MTDKLQQAIAEIEQAPAVPMQGGKMYTMVQDRVVAFRKTFAFEYGIETKLLKDDGKTILMQAIITDKSGRTIGSGHAEEVRGSSNVNKTSPIENGESSAIGRALASLALHGGEYASANEMDKVKRMEESKPAVTEKSEPPPKQEDKTPACLLNEDGSLNWAGDQIQGMEDHPHLGHHMAWKELNHDTLKLLAAQNHDAYQLVVKAYHKRKSVLTNGG